ncbi:MAG: hypothetical protein ACAI25_04155 [Planctomycetota bacterium]
MMETVVLVPSCDRYSDLWAPFFALFRRFWPDCPYRVCLLTNELTPRIPGIDVIAVGPDVSWSDNLAAALARLPERYVLMFIEDLFIVRRVRSAQVTRIVSEAIRIGARYLRLSNTPPPDAPFNRSFGLVAPGALYRTSTVLSLWDRLTLASLLATGESAWQFETAGSVRSDTIDGFYATRRPLIHVANGVIKGRWRRSVLRELAPLGVRAGDRGVMTVGEEFRFRLLLARSRLLAALPSNRRRQVRRVLSEWLGWARHA